tara:strand:+ start:26904 stop:27338 length:435 start_codon:yes stop_codon:yes gene_type:complete
MKYLIILLFTFNAYAEFKVEIIPDNTSWAKGGFEKQDEVKAKEHLLKIINKSQWMKTKWNYVESPISRTKKGMDGIEVTTYMHPKNFTYEIKDMTEEIAAEEAAKAADKAERQELKAMKSDVNASDLPNWHKKILRRYLKSLRD